MNNNINPNKQTSPSFPLNNQVRGQNVEASNQPTERMSKTSIEEVGKKLNEFEINDYATHKLDNINEESDKDINKSTEEHLYPLTAQFLLVMTLSACFSKLDNYFLPKEEK